MSLMYSEIQKKYAVIAADSRRSTILYDGTTVILDDDTPKLIVGHDFVMFMSGNYSTVIAAVNDIFQPGNNGIINITNEKITNILKKHHQQYINYCVEKNINPISNGDTVMSCGIFLLRWVDGRPIGYMFSPENDFSPQIGKCDDRSDIWLMGYTEGWDVDIPTWICKKQQQYIAENKTQFGDLLNLIKDLYAEYNSEKVGGKLSIFMMDDNGINRLVYEPIPDKSEYRYMNIEGDSHIIMNGDIRLNGDIAFGTDSTNIKTLYCRGDKTTTTINGETSTSYAPYEKPTANQSYISYGDTTTNDWHKVYDSSHDRWKVTGYKVVTTNSSGIETTSWVWSEPEEIQFLTYIDSDGIYTGTIVANHIYGGHISTNSFELSGSYDTGYMDMYKQLILFNEPDSNGVKGDTKMAIGFLGGEQYNEPVIIMGAGDTQGNNIGYINKGASSLDMYYKGTSNNLAYIHMKQDGTIYINGVEFTAAPDTDQNKIDLMTKANYWNAKLDGVKQTIDNRSVYTLKDGNSDADISIGSLGQLCYVENNKIHFNPNVVLDWNAVYVLYGRGNYATPTNAYSSYPSTSSSGWHKTLDTTNDLYASYSYDGGNTWSAAIKIQGSDGSDGVDGKDGKDGSDANVPNYIKSTYIDFDEVVSPQIKGNFVMGGKVYGGEYWNSDEKAYIKVGTSTGNYGDFALYSKNNNTPRYQIYDNNTSIDFKALGTQFMYTSGSSTYPQGTWDFSNATVTGISGSMTPKFG